MAKKSHKRSHRHYILPTKSKGSVKQPTRVGFYLIVVILLGIAAALAYRYWQISLPPGQGLVSLFPSKPTVSGAPTPSPTPIRLHNGKGEYAVSQGKHEGPTITMVTFDPLDARKGKKLTLTIKVTNPSSVISVSGTLETDGKPVSLTFQKINSSASDSTWQAETKLVDTLWYRYVLTVKAKADNGESTVVVAPRGD